MFGHLHCPVTFELLKMWEYALKIVVIPEQLLQYFG